MALLKKTGRPLRAATLMETLVATVLIVVIFMVSSLILNNLFAGTVRGNTRKIETRLNELEYGIKNNIQKLPYSETFGEWNIAVTPEKQGRYGSTPPSGQGYAAVIMEARLADSEKKTERRIICKDHDKTP